MMKNKLTVLVVNSDRSQLFAHTSAQLKTYANCSLVDKCNSRQRGLLPSLAGHSLASEHIPTHWTISGQSILPDFYFGYTNSDQCSYFWLNYRRKGSRSLSNQQTQMYLINI